MKIYKDGIIFENNKDRAGFYLMLFGVMIAIQILAIDVAGINYIISTLVVIIFAIIFIESLYLSADEHKPKEEIEQTA